MKSPKDSEEKVMATNSQAFVQTAQLQSRQGSRSKLWAGRIITTLAALFMLFDSVMHLLKPAPVVEAFARLGLPLSLSVPLGIMALICVAFYALPETSVLG